MTSGFDDVRRRLRTSELFSASSLDFNRAEHEYKR